MHVKNVIYGVILLVAAGLANPIQAAQHSRATASEFVTELAQRAFATANNRSLTQSDRQLRFAELLDSEFDVPQIASFVLGRFWQQASDAERQEFVAAFRMFVLRTYSDRFTGYDDGSFRVLGQRAADDDITIVYTEIVDSVTKQPVKVEWRIDERSGRKIVDMSVSGISMAMTKREEFASYLRRNEGGLPVLIDRLRTMASAQRK